MTQFNEELIEKQKVTIEQKTELEKLYILLEGTVNTSKILQEKDSLNFTTGHILASTVKDIEFMLQKNWNFDQNEEYHSYWFRMPGCTCPIMDNQERLGTPYGIITVSCPYHGSEEESKPKNHNDK